MLITIVATLCHSLGTIPAPVCREEIIARTDTMAACLFLQPALAEWKARSIYANEAWTVARVKCMPGDYQVRERV